MKIRHFGDYIRITGKVQTHAIHGNDKAQVASFFGVVALIDVIGRHAFDPDLTRRGAFTGR